MILHFPNDDALRLGLTSGVVPQDVAAAPVAAGFGDAGEVWVRTEQRLAANVVTELRQLGVKSHRSARKVPAAMDEHLCWHQLLSLSRVADIWEQDGKLPVLFELQHSEQLPGLAAEMLRLGNDRQSFCFLSNDHDGANTRALLRVIGPPYYSLLQATARDGRPDAPRAYVEQSPRVWVQVGYRHELAERIQPPPGQMLLLRSPRDWVVVDEAPLRDVYELLDFQLPASPAEWQESEQRERVSVPLRLAPGTGAGETAELWVLRDDASGNGAAEEIERLVHNSDDQLLARLAFAVGERDGVTTIVLRVRPSKQPPPVLVLGGEAFRTYLKIPNLFLPVGRRLHPPLRRDAVARLLVEDNDRITWLYPETDGRFRPESLPDAAFRPLSDWVDYVLDTEHEPLAAWVASHRFEFESFVCSDGRPAKEKPPQPQRPRDKKQPQRETRGKQPSQGKQPQRPRREQPGSDAALKLSTGGKEKAKASELKARLRNLEQQFRDSDAPLDSPDRAELWQRMAVLHTNLRHRQEATVCWSNALWEQDALSAVDVAKWLRCEQHGAQDIDFDESQLQRLEKVDIAPQTDASIYAAWLVRSAQQAEPPTALTARLPVLSQFLERQEPFLPVRTAWLAWVALARLAGDDVLALARARDRLLERLFQQGLRPEFDMARFLRTSGHDNPERSRVVRERVVQLRRHVSQWIVEPQMGGNPQTKAYVDLILAYALARLGEAAECRRLATRAREALAGDDVHVWLRDAYLQRIEEALQGRAARGRLSPALLEMLQVMDRLERYKVDRLRNCSRILEPTERINPYRRWNLQFADDLSRELSDLFDLDDRAELSTRVVRLVDRLRGGRLDSAPAVRILDAALELSPRLGEAFAVELLDQIDPVLKSTDDVVGRAVLLEKGMLVGGHFDKADRVQALTEHFETELPAIVNIYMTLNVQHAPENKEKIDAIDSLFSQSFRGMRKLGMRDLIGRLFGRLDQLLTEHGDAAAGAVRRHKLALTVAGGWFYFGQHDPAERTVNQVRNVLFKGGLAAIDQRMLACAYLHAVGQAPVEWALDRIEELFSVKKGKRRLQGIEDNMTTSSHYSVSQLDVVETLVATLVSDDNALNAEGRRWLDEDEFLVRRRIHRDVRQALQAAEA